MAVTLPEKLDYYSKAGTSINRMYLNDTYGCCVISDHAHQLGVWSANDSDSGGVVLANDSEIRQQYFGVCGPNDQGCYIPNVLDHIVANGFTAGGKTYGLDGYVSVDWANQDLVKAAMYLFGSLKIGFLYQRYGPDEPWPATGKAHTWACGYCGFKPDCWGWATTSVV